MGNCMRSCKNGQTAEEMVTEEIKRVEKEKVRRAEKRTFVKESAFEKSSLKVKIVLTKQELQWLTLQLRDNEGKGLEACLGEIGRERNNKKVGTWKPSLERIME